MEDDRGSIHPYARLFADMRNCRFQLEMVQVLSTGPGCNDRNQHDVCLSITDWEQKTGLNCSRKPWNGLSELAHHSSDRAWANIEVDVEAMKAGARIISSKPVCGLISLERSVRYALERKRAAAGAAFEQASLAAFGADVGLAYQRETLQRHSLPLRRFHGALFECASGADLDFRPSDQMFTLRPARARSMTWIARPILLTKLNPDKNLVG